MDNEQKSLKLKELVDSFHDNIIQYKSGAYKEAKTRMDYIDKFFELLDWDIRNDKHLTEEYREVVIEDSLIVEEANKAPDYSFRKDGKVQFYVEAKKPSINIKEDKNPAHQVRSYGWSGKIPLCILTDFEEFAVYDTRIKPIEDDSSSIARVYYFTYNQYEENFDLIYDLFSKSAVYSDSLNQYALENKTSKGNLEVDRDFLNLIEGWREELAKNIAVRNIDLDIYQLNYAVQKIIDRIVFLRISEDRELEVYETLKRMAENIDVYKKFTKYFETANIKYNSGLFETEDYIINLNVDDLVLKNIVKQIYSPKCPYKFNIIGVEILGNIYEQFLGKTIRLTEGHRAKVEEKPEARKAGGVFYTPQYIVKYIVENTVGEKIKGKSPEEIELIKIVDPACGSGSFLIGAYDYLLNYYFNFYIDGKNIKKSLKENKIYQISENSYRLTIQEKQKVLINNIFGVDIDLQAVEVTKLSLLLKLLEDENKQRSDDLFKYSNLKLLPDLSENIKCGNSLIGSDFYKDKDLSLFGDDDMRKINIFDWEKEFSEIFKTGGFDCVIGNPPYVVLESENNALNYYKNKYNAARGGKINLYKLFIENGHNLNRKLGYLGYICPSSYLSSSDSIELRKLILENTKIIEIIEYTEKDKVFHNVTQALTTIVFQKGESIDNIFPFRTSKHGRNNVSQNEFIKNKDLEFIPLNSVIKKIKEQKLIFSDVIEGYQGEINVSINKDSFIYNKKIDCLPLYRGNLITNYRIITEPSEYCPINIDKRGHYKIERIVFQEVSNQQQKRRVKAALLNINNLCGHTTNYCFYKNQNYNNFIILGLLNSTLINYYFSYFNNTNHIPIGEIKNIPVAELNERTKDILEKLVLQMLAARKELHASTITESGAKFLQQKVDAIDRQIDRLVYDLYGLTEEEIKIVEGK